MAAPDPLDRPEAAAHDPWAVSACQVARMVLHQSRMCLDAYEANPALIEEHANIERSVTQGGYGHRQLYELVQNGADELQKEPGHGIQVVLTEKALYCANGGTPVTPEGVQTILASHLSRKRGTEIGRFGLGFKSVLSVSDRPQFFSRTGSFGWDRVQARRLTRARVTHAGPVPVLRLAHLLDPKIEGRNDPVLKELMGWASTVVKLPLLDQHADRLALDIQNFPAKFAIFSPHIGELILEDRRTAQRTTRREIYVKGEGNSRTLFTDEKNQTSTSDWIVFEAVHAPSAAARKEAGEYHDRVEIPVTWAVPTSGQHGLGQFWAFFPTNYETTLRGVINAPWKTNEDRQNLLQNNAFNDELMQVAARLVVSAMPELSTAEDPARHLTLITARGKEPRNWADGMLTDLVYRFAAEQRSLPDQTGELVEPSKVHLHPEKLEKRWLERWASYPGRPSNWCHPSVEETVRRSRAEIVLERVGKGPSTVDTWLEALVSDNTAAASAVAVSIVADMVHQRHPHADQARSARVLRTESGTMVPPIQDTVFTRADLDVEPDGLAFVDPDLMTDSSTAWSLSVLGIREADATGRLAGLLKRGFGNYVDADWARFWQVARVAGADATARQLAETRIGSAILRVRVRAGRFRPLTKCLLPGRVLAEGSEADTNMVVDTDFHAADVGLLRALGMSDGPRVSVNPRPEPWFIDYRDQMVRFYYKRLPVDASRPHEQNIVVDGTDPAGPLQLLPELSDEAKERFIASIPAVGIEARWNVHARTRRDKPLPVQSPLVWMLRKHGVLRTSRGLRSVRHCVGPGMRPHARILPVADVDPALATALMLPHTVDEISETLWSVLLDEYDESESDAEVGAFYGLAASELDPVDAIRCKRRDGWCSLAPGEVAATADREQYERLLRHDVPAILTEDTDVARRLITDWGLQIVDQALVTELRATPIGDPVPLEDVFPALRLIKGRPARRLSLIRCRDVEELVRTPNGQVPEPLDIGTQDDVVYWRERDDDLALLRQLSTELGLGLSESRCREILDQRELARRSERIVKVRREKDATDKLCEMLPAKALREKIPKAVVDAVETRSGAIDHRILAELAISVHGTRVLSEYRSELEQNGFSVPTQMAGSHEARRFTQDLGFPTEFAGFRRPPLSPVLMVDGPVDFPPLHAYQEQMVQRVFEALQSSDTRGMRGMLSLPTGAGKTRVVVEAMTRHLGFLGPREVTRPILWIAQSEELCEQAVQSWHFVWRNIGPAMRLTISRLWSGNDADPMPEGAHLVVATDAKLNVVLGSDRYEWLRGCQAVVVDEAHTSISPLYTRLLESLGLTARKTRCPLIGLSATPFRGVNVEETDRLTSRYGKNRFDHTADEREILGDNPYRTLQDFGVLARVEHRILQGSTIHLTDQEHANLRQLHRLPASAEDRLGQDQCRNTTLIDEILSLPDDWQTLVFATSVDHALTLAALLRREGVAASPISGSTPEGERRHIIDQFGKQRVRVLTNYGVLTQGFDAPKTRAVIVARPTYSPNVYQQMIGRGLRGPRNGGEEECLIVNVADNVAQYGEQLAFRQFEYLWRNDA